MAMRMLQAGGVALVTDAVRAPDDDNLDGYFEFEPVKELDKGDDCEWLRGARGKAVKVVSWLLTWLPDAHDYRVVFMQRDLDEVIASQNTMLRRRGESGIEDAAAMRQVYATHLEQVQRFLERRSCFTTSVVSYRDVVERPAVEAGRLAEFVQRPLDIDRMAAAVDARRYRNRSG